MSKGTRSQADKPELDIACVMEKLQKLDTLDTINSKLDTIDTRQQNIETKQFTMDTELKDVKKRLVNVETFVTKSETTEQCMKMAIRSYEIAKIQSEANSREYNAIMFNVLQTEVHETRKTSLELVREVLANVLEIPDAHLISIRNAHRLPASKGRAPLIFKLNSMYDKDKIWSNINKLKLFNDSQLTNATKIYIDMTNLPQKLQKDKKSLLTKYNALRNSNSKPRWFYDKKAGEYTIKVGGKIIRPPTDSFDFKINDPVTNDVQSDASTSSNVTYSTAVLQNVGNGGELHA